AELEYERATVQYFYTRQRQLLGLGHAVSCARSFVGNQPFVVALGDSIIGMHAASDVVERMTRCYREQHAAAVIAFEEVPLHEVSQYGIAQPKTEPATGDELFEIADLVEKPSPRETPSTLAIAARYVLSPAIFDALAQTKRGKGGEIQLTDAISVRNYFAEVVLYEWDSVEIVLADDDRAKFDSVYELARDVRLHGYYGGIRLIKATIKRFVEYCQARDIRLHDRKFSVRYQTTI